MMKTILVSLLGLVLLGALGACGSPSDVSHLVGTYTLDVDKTWGGRPGVMLTGAANVGDEVTQALKTQFAPEAYRFELRDDMTFALHVGLPPTGFVLEGSWGLGTDGIRLQADRMNGEPAAPEDAPIEDVRVDGEWLVLGDAGQSIYLRRQ